ncbi:putative F-box/LRR-repeat protein At3g28410 [Corylus avellana]|uniref:putative F-box/LRR-repeat protein At3g28410 n=1 Tax=Corylus avellana TaxID=13451 RepID=UPI00286A8AB6|nr:putative F-box/LRR-repeat protein At3g28410 [Corylus avellana]
MPEHIVHHIMSFLPTTSATRVSALSKNFNSAWLSFPVFDFDEALYEGVIGPSGDRTEFLDFVLASLKKRCPSDIYIQRFSLRVWAPEISDNRIQNSIRLAVDRNVNELVVEIQTFQNNYCRLPRTALQNARLLSVLKLSGFSFEFEDLIPCLNLVEDLSLDSCSVSANFMLSSAKLKDLKLGFCRGLEKIEIDALNLQFFSYSAYHEEQHPCEINLSHCKNLRSLTLEESTISDDWVEDHVSQLVLLRNLKLIACRNLHKIKISNRQLVSFELLGCEKLLKAKIEAPNLISFDYSGNIPDTTSPPKIILLCCTLAHAKLYLTTRKLTIYSFFNLRNFLTRFGHCKTLSLSLGSDQALIFPKEMREYLVHPLLDLRHMRVELHSLSSLTGLVDGLLWLAPNLETMFISVKAALKSLMLNLQFYKWSPRSEDHMIKKVKFVKYEGNNDEKMSMLNFFHEKAIRVEANSDH